MRRGRRGRPHLLCPPCPPIGRRGGSGAETAAAGAETAAAGAGTAAAGAGTAAAGPDSGGPAKGQAGARALRSRCAGRAASSSSQPRARRGHGRSTSTLRAVSGRGEPCRRGAPSARSQDRSREALSRRGSCLSAKPVSSVRLRGAPAVQPHRICVPRICFNQSHRKLKQGGRHCVAHLLGRVRPVQSGRVLQRSAPVLVPFLLRGQVRLPVVLHDTRALERRPPALSAARAATLSKTSRGSGHRRESSQRASAGHGGRPSPGRQSRPEPSTPGQVKKHSSPYSDPGASKKGSSPGPQSSTDASKKGSSSGSQLPPDTSKKGSSPGPQPPPDASKKGSSPGPQLPSEASQDSSMIPQLSSDSTELLSSSSSQDKAPGTSPPLSSSSSPSHSPDGHSSGSQGYVASGSASGSRMPSKVQGKLRGQARGRAQARAHGISSSQPQLHQPRSILATRPAGARQGRRQRPSQGSRQAPSARSKQRNQQTPSARSTSAQPPDEAPSELGTEAPQTSRWPRTKWSTTSMPQPNAPCCSESSLGYSSESSTEMACAWPGHGLHCLQRCWQLGYPAC